MSRDLFSTCAQIIPTLAITLIVEQGLFFSAEEKAESKGRRFTRATLLIVNFGLLMAVVGESAALSALTWVPNTLMAIAVWVSLAVLAMTIFIPMVRLLMREFPPRAISLSVRISWGAILGALGIFATVVGAGAPIFLLSRCGR